MRVTTHLSLWLMTKVKDRGVSWRELGRLAGLSFMTVRRVATGGIDEIETKTEDALCKMFNITHDELRAIADGHHTQNSVTDCAKQALWAWLAQDPQRSAVIRALGYAGPLPDIFHQPLPSQGCPP